MKCSIWIRPARIMALLSLSLLMADTFGQAPEGSPDISGAWAGSFQVAQYDPMELVFHINQSADGLSAILDIPSQQQYGISVDRVTLRNGQLFMQVSTIQAEFYGGLQLGRDGTTVRRITGDWAQSGEFVPLTLRPRAPTEQQ